MKRTFPNHFSIKTVLIVCLLILSSIKLKEYFYDLSRLYEDDTFSVLRKSLPCKNKPFEFEIEQHGDFWLFKNFVRAAHGELNCYESVTYATHGDLTFLSKLIPLVERWKAPVSVALETPGTDFHKTLNTIFYYRKCKKSKHIIRQYVTFHFFFDNKHIPIEINKDVEKLEKLYECPRRPPYVNKTSNDLYKRKNKMNYHINVARNLAKKCALTYFVLSSDIELYPNPGLVPKFLNMIAKNMSLILNGNNVFFLPVFEIKHNQRIPSNKKQLKHLVDSKKARFFHLNICKSCHQIPKMYTWLKNTNDKEMKIYANVKRVKEHHHWEPFFIATQDDPIIFDERLTWEGKFNKMTMAYILCLLDYNFLGLSNAFLVHSPGTKSISQSTQHRSQGTTARLVTNTIFPEIIRLYGSRKGCKMF